MPGINQERNNQSLGGHCLHPHFYSNKNVALGNYDRLIVDTRLTDYLYPTPLCKRLGQSTSFFGSFSVNAEDATFLFE